MRLATAAALLAALTGAPASAADRALVDLVGYSPDGRYFAYEAFGTHDGSGAPFAGVTIVDLDAGLAVQPLNFAAEGGEESLLRPIRAEARDKARADLDRLVITEPAQYVSMVGDGVAGADGEALRFGQPGSGWIGEVYDDRLVTLQTLETESTAGCDTTYYPDERALGLALNVWEGGVRRLLYSDPLQLPAWRGCPIDYRLYAAVLPSNGDMSRAAALISVYTTGWEGADRNFMVMAIGK